MDREKSIDPYCVIEDVVNLNLPVYAACASHGICDDFTGECVCMPGFHGTVCDDNTDSRDKHVFQHDGPFFTGR